jgi:HPt (histidine-containing phosphotransfer) domain-containing protein
MDNVIIDYPQLLKNIGGSEELARSLTQDFVLGMPKFDKNLASLLETMDMGEIKVFIHKVRGVGANLCARDLVACAQQVSICVKEQKIEETKDALRDLKSALDQLGLWILNHHR